ncbi:MerR family transcriptional regulator [Microlunatus speluncae]|uniref:MerR family transcriptional regulator n=1 Tax=Microlunatus speluncae TaxID=2594267 RepID=UPI001C2D87C8|nr:MerR family transcriptional regulator [Microlunatus speluncae]
MLNIGEFAQWAGLTVKALHLYDERGILAPAEVDPHSGYRRYAASQLRDAMMIKALRDADVPLAEVASAVAAPDRAVELLEQHRERVVAAREAEDRAADRSRQVLAGMDVVVPVEFRTAAPQPYAGVLIELAADDATEGDDDDAANQAFAALWQRLAETGNPPTGSFWTTIRSAREPERAELVLCWPVARQPDADFALDGHRVETGILPERDELVATWQHNGTEATEDALHPAAVALFEEAERRGVDLEVGLLRQIGLTDQAGTPTAIELAYGLTAH